MLLSILLPVYNEKGTLVQLIEKIFSVDWPCDIEVIAVDDGSTDSTKTLLVDLSKRYDRLRVYSHKKNQGKGASIKTAFENSKGEVIAIQDADLEYEPAEIVKLLKPILDNQADVAYGSRFLNKVDSNRIHRFANRFLTLLSNFFTGLDLTDMETCQKVIKREFLKDITIRSKRFGIEPELTAKLAKKGARFVELPISYKFRSYDEGKKITWWDGVKACFAIIYFHFFE